MWYYQHNNEQIGPLEQAQFEALIAAGTIGPRTLVRAEGMDDWQPAAASPAASWLGTGTASDAGVDAAAARPLTRVSEPSPLEQARMLEAWFLLFWISLALGIPLTFVVVGLAGLAAAVLLYCFMLYRLWELIPPARARTTPGRAVGFLFLPLYNLYWNFIAFWGLAKALNRELQSAGITGRDVDERLALAYCVLICLAIVPEVGLLALIAALVLWIVLVKQMKDAGVALLLAEAATSGVLPDPADGDAVGRGTAS